MGMGPLGPRAVLVRPPADVDSYGGFQTWFRDCSAAGQADGTVPDASWFNHVTGQFVYAANKVGVSMTNNDNDDSYLLAIIEAAISLRLASFTSGTVVSPGGGGGGGGAWTLI